MNFQEAQKLITEIELNYDVMSFKYKNVSVWPFLKIYLQDNLSVKRANKVSKSTFLLILKSLFFYNPVQLFRKYKLWVYSSTDTRKKIGAEYINHVSGSIPLIETSTLKLETPQLSKRHFFKSTIPEKFIISNAWSIIFTGVLEFLLRIKPLDIKNEKIIKDVLDKYGIMFNYKKHIRILYAQRLSTEVLLFLGHKPNVVFIEVPYTKMGYLWAFHKHNIPVVELQHGVLNSKHNAYNSLFNAEILAPDEICVYGEEEFKYLTEKTTPYSNKITKTGLFILEKSDVFFQKDIFKEYRGNYEEIVIVSGQTGYEKQLASFIDQVALRTPKNKFIYIPRRKTKIYFKAKNISLIFGVNIYEYLKWCDIHCTIFSTTCLEAHYFSKPNILFDYNNIASNYYRTNLDEVNGFYYINNVDEFIKALYAIRNNKLTYKELFADNHFKRMKDVISRYTR